MHEDSISNPMAPRRRPLAVPAVAFAGGIAAASWIGVAAFLVPGALVGAILWRLGRGDRSSALVIAAAGLGFSLGALRLLVFLAPPAPDSLAWIPRGEPMPVKVRGRVVARPPLADARSVEPLWRVTVRTDAIERRGSWVPCSGKLRLTVRGAGLDLHRGDRIEATGMLRDLPDPGNPGQFDFGDHLSASGIVRIVSVPAPDAVRILRPGAPGPLRWLEVLRARLSRALADALPGTDGALLAALLLGDQSRLDTDAREAFARSGTVHLLAVSGLHLMLVASGILVLLRLCNVQGRWAVAGVLLFVWIYAGLTGGRTPVLRAAVMTSFYLGADLMGRERDSWNALSVSALVLLALRPSDLFAPGFQLSFAAVAGIVAFARPIADALTAEEALVLQLSKMEADRRRAAFGRAVGLSVGVSVAAWAATAPLALAHFNLVAPVVPLANLLAAPLTAGLLAVGFFCLPWMVLLPAFAPAALPAAFLSRLLSESARFFAGLPFSHVYLPAPSTGRIAVAYGLLLLLAVRPRWPRRLRRLWALVAVLAGLAVFLPARAKPLGGLEWTVLDVGQGSSSVFRFPDGRVLVYDAGTRGDFEVGEWVIAPFLWNAGVRRIHLLALSHADTDHISAAESLLERFAVDAAVVPWGFDRRAEGQRLLERLRAEGVPFRCLHRGSPPPPGWEGALEILHPPPPGSGAGFLSSNNGSLVLAARFAGRRVLLPGDLERAGLDLLAARLDGVAFDAVLAPHHGSDETAGHPFPMDAGPALAVFSCGWFFEVDETAAQYAARGIPVLRTCRDGAVTVRISGTGAITAGGFRSGPDEGGKVHDATHD